MQVQTILITMISLVIKSLITILISVLSWNIVETSGDGYSKVSPINQDYWSGGRIKSYCILFEDIYYSLESFGSIQTGQHPPFILENLK